MADYSLLDLRRFTSDILPFFGILVTGESRGDNSNAFNYFANAFCSREFIDISEDQKISSGSRYCMYLVNFHDYVEGALHVNMQTAGRDVYALTYTPELIKVRKVLTRLELAPSSDLDEICEELYLKTSSEDESKFNVLIKCLHVYFMHILVLNIEIQRAINQITSKTSSGSKKRQWLATRICVAPELPSYLADVLKCAYKYCTKNEIVSLPGNIDSIFARETNIGFNVLKALAEYETISPIIAAYAATSRTIPEQSADAVNVCNSILSSELWRNERSVAK